MTFKEKVYQILGTKQMTISEIVDQLIIGGDMRDRKFLTISINSAMRKWTELIINKDGKKTLSLVSGPTVTFVKGLNVLRGTIVGTKGFLTLVKDGEGKIHQVRSEGLKHD